MGSVMERVHSSLLKIRISVKVNGQKERESNGWDQLKKATSIRMKIPIYYQHRLLNKSTLGQEEKLGFKKI